MTAPGFDPWAELALIEAETAAARPAPSCGEAIGGLGALGGKHPAAVKSALSPERAQPLPSVTEVVVALAATPGQRIAEAASASAYFEAEARRRIAKAEHDEQARELLVRFLRHRRVK